MDHHDRDWTDEEDDVVYVEAEESNRPLAFWSKTTSTATQLSQTQDDVEEEHPYPVVLRVEKRRQRRLEQQKQQQQRGGIYHNASSEDDEDEQDDDGTDALENGEFPKKGSSLTSKPHCNTQDEEDLLDSVCSYLDRQQVQQQQRLPREDEASEKNVITTKTVAPSSTNMMTKDMERQERGYSRKEYAEITDEKDTLNSSVSPQHEDGDDSLVAGAEKGITPLSNPETLRREFIAPIHSRAPLNPTTESCLPVTESFACSQTLKNPALTNSGGQESPENMNEDHDNIMFGYHNMEETEQTNDDVSQHLTNDSMVELNMTTSLHQEVARQRPKRSRKTKAASSSYEDVDNDRIPILETARRIKRRTELQKSVVENRQFPSAPVGIKKAKSIVGSRPQHWGSSNLANRSQSVVSLSQSNRSLGRHLSATLSNATKNHGLTRGSIRRTGHKKSVLSNMTNSSMSSTAMTSATPLENAPLSDKRMEVSVEQSLSGTRWNPNVNIREMNFRPAFLKNDGAENEATDRFGTDGVQEIPDEDGSSRFVSQEPNTLMTPMSTPSNGTFVTPAKSPRRKQQRRKAGPLMMELKNLTNSIEGDAIRLQSGTYPFRDLSNRRGRDVSDPRNRATSYMDVSIIGDPFPWISSGEEKITVFGFVHCTVVTRNNGPSDSAKSLRQESLEQCESDEEHRETSFLSRLSHGRKEPHHAWIHFTSDTTRERKIAKGIQLRIYDAIEVGYNNIMRCTNRNDGFPSVICTRICELYPSILPPLPDISTDCGE